MDSLNVLAGASLTPFTEGSSGDPSIPIVVGALLSAKNLPKPVSVPIGLENDVKLPNTSP